MTVPPLSAVSAATAASTTPSTEAVRKAGRDFETVFVGQMLQTMFSGIGTGGPFGGGQAETTWRGFMLDRYAEAIAQSGSLGIGRQVEAEILRLQDAAGGV